VPDPEPPLPPRVGGFRVLARLGGGGRTYLAAAADGGRVVVKLTGPGETPGAAAAGAAAHPNLARVVVAGEEGGVRFLATEFVEGETLGAVVRAGGPLPPATAVGYAAQAAAGLAHLHDSGWAHGDVKPDNLLVTPFGDVKVIDLGLTTRADKPTADPTGFRGTPAFAAPEVLLGRGRPGRRADVFGLGATLFYLLAGRPPYPRASAAELVLWLLAGESRPQPRLPAGLPPALAGVLRRMLAPDPEARHADAGAARAALLAVTAGSPAG